MKKFRKYLFVAVLMALPMMSVAASINNVDFTQQEDVVYITYYLKSSEPLKNVTAYMSLDGGKTYRELQNVSGDVGSVSGSGAKRVAFEIFKELGNDDISGRICFKVKGHYGIDNSVIDMVTVEGGTFQMGRTTGYDDERPVHSVTVSTFQIGMYELTQGQWEYIMGNNPSYFKKGDNYPVENVSWSDVQEFIKRLNARTGKRYRLPTEAEWEFAARGGNKSRGYKYSGSEDVDAVAWYDSNSGIRTHPVGTKSPNELGIYDMSGNVWEWCSDWYGDYSSSAQHNPTGATSGADRVGRGGGWSRYAKGCRVSYRDYNNPGYRDDYIGFRLVLP